MPTPFDGTRSKTLDFIHECDLVIESNDTDKNKTTAMNFMLSYMKKGAALSWAKRYREAANNANQVNTYAELKKKVLEAFKEADPARNARTRLQNLVQGTKHSVDAYISMFNEYTDLTTYDDQSTSSAPTTPPIRSPHTWKPKC